MRSPVIGRFAPLVELRDIIVNGESGLALIARGTVISILSIRTDGASILDVFTVLNPDKLRDVSAL